ncbi:PEP-CTERM sorting domain-containing protein [Duganella sp. HH101]|uniref:PEP-CTERM sorting domain-containing protein n=1 Tax=Duganella sp. HH101 TaxID=1781066 RepID=UPI0008754566|nr:PEP-CTERM sorting domain-containing protein [Duganella sp. HH101]OFA01952.1 PEP-CTERM motif protein [Duganella sp. HH101]
MKISIAALLASLTLASGAHADVLTYEYTAQISYLTIYHWASTQDPIATTTLAGGRINFGDTVTGRFSIDALAAHAPEAHEDGFSSVSYKPSMQNQLTANFGSGSDGFKLNSTSFPELTPTAWVGNSSTGNGTDTVIFHSGFSSPDRIHEITLAFSDASGAALSGTDIPTSLSGLGERTFEYKLFWHPDHEFAAIIAKGAITSLNLVSVSAVPEPGTYLMFLAGLPLLAWRRRAARQ